MSAISRILLPVDFSPHGVGAARYAGALADHFKAELTVLNVIETFHWIPASAWEYSAEFQAEAVQACRIRGSANWSLIARMNSAT